MKHSCSSSPRSDYEPDPYQRLTQRTTFLKSVEKRHAVQRQLEAFNERISTKFTKFYTSQFKPMQEVHKQIKAQRRSFEVQCLKKVAPDNPPVVAKVKYRAPSDVRLLRIDSCMAALDLSRDAFFE